MRSSSVAATLFVIGILVGALGCQRVEPLQFLSSKEVRELPADVQNKIRKELDKYCGTPLDPKSLETPAPAPSRLRHGADVYQRRCAACHGVSGDGAGMAAANMYPRPRDYRRGIFKFISTYSPSGSTKPLRSDLVRTVRLGARGTAMPAFNLLPEEDIEDVVDYVIALTHRGELEQQLAIAAAEDGAVDPEETPAKIKMIQNKWASADRTIVLPVSTFIPYSDESMKAGEKAFLSEDAGCYKCHGNDGRGQSTENAKGFDDIWGFHTRAADLTSGMLHGGNRPLDIYRRIYAGINGTPMPAFRDKLAKDPELFWHLVHYVEHVSSARREQVVKQHPGMAVASPTAAEIED